MDKQSGIGVFDSGVGGLTVASRIARMLPQERIFYFGDTAHVPYGDKTEAQITGYVYNIIDFLKSQNVKAMVMACNTSSAVVLPKLNGNIDIPVIGMIEDASKQALRVSPKERIGVVANPVTVRSGAYVGMIKGFSRNGVRIYQKACPRWVPLIESGKTSGEEVELVLREDLQPLIESGIDTLILGCTHYPYFASAIKKVIPDGIAIVDPAAAVVERLREVLSARDLLSDTEKPEHRFFVSGDAEEFRLKGSWFFGQWIETVEQVDLDGNISNLCMGDSECALAIAS